MFWGPRCRVQEAFQEKAHLTAVNIFARDNIYTDPEGAWGHQRERQCQTSPLTSLPLALEQHQDNSGPKMKEPHSEAWPKTCPLYQQALPSVNLQALKQSNILSCHLANPTMWKRPLPWNSLLQKFNIFKFACWNKLWHIVLWRADKHNYYSHQPTTICNLPLWVQGRKTPKS